MTLGGQAHEFRAALRLLDLLEAWPKDQRDQTATTYMSSWSGMCFRDASLQLNHFGTTLQAINRLFGRCPTIRSLIDRQAMKEGNKLWDAELKGSAKVRHAVAHAGESFATQEGYDRNSLKDGEHGGPGMILVSGGSSIAMTLINERTYSVSMNGQFVSFDLTEKTVDLLDAVAAHVFRAFQAAEMPLEKLWYAKSGQEIPRRLRERWANSTTNQS